MSNFEIAGSIKGDVNKKTSPSAGSREIFCLDIQPTVCRWLSIAREVLLWIALPFPRFIFEWSQRPSILETWQAIRFRGNHGSIRGSWPIAISGSPRGHSVRTVTRCRSTQGRTTYLILPSKPSVSRTEPTTTQEDGTSSLPETLKLLADVIRWRRSTLLSSKSSK